MRNFMSEKSANTPRSVIREFVGMSYKYDNVLSFGFGQPDFVTPKHITDAMKESLDRGESFYAPNTGILPLGVYHGAYMAEVVRAGIEAIPKGQFEAACSQGFGYLQRMYYVILPQSIKIILPPMVNQVVNLIKNTSCLYIVGGADLISVTYSFVTGENTGGAYAPAYLVSGLLFFLVCCPLSSLASMWETSLKRRDVRQNKAERMV